MKFIRLTLLALAFASLSTAALAQAVDVKGAWARATVQGQMATGVFMTLTAKERSQLVSIKSPVAGVAEVHEMKMDGDVMKMRALEGGLALPAGKAVELKPSGYHVMLMDLRTPLLKDTSIPMTLVFKDAKGALSNLGIMVPVSTTAPAGASNGHAGHKM